jgi:hypothetical protein
MAQFPRSLKISSLALLGAAAVAAIEVPAGTEIQIRLKSKVSTQSSKAKDTVDAVVIAPVMAGADFVIPAGAAVHGVVEKESQSAKGDERSTLLLTFNELEFGGAKVRIGARVAEVDNAREKVDDQGQINGMLASETITGRLDAGINKVAEKYSGIAEVLGIAKGAVFKSAESDVTYEPGVEMTLKLTAPLTVKSNSGPGPAAQVKPVEDEPALIALIAAEPFQTIAENPPKPSDITNLLLIGTEEQVRQAFTDAGWTAPAALSGVSKFETLRAVAENRGYKEAPVSILLLDGKPPDLVFQKMNNTFANRHHLRIWRRPATFHGRPVWAVAATHDIGIEFSEQNRTFIHKIDSRIDRERAKVVNDLLLTGRVESVELVDRPQVPQKSQNATGDALETDARIAVLALK